MVEMHQLKKNKRISIEGIKFCMSDTSEESNHIST